MLCQLTDNVFVQGAAIGTPIGWEQAVSAPTDAQRAYRHAVHFFQGNPAAMALQQRTAQSILSARECFGPVDLLSITLEGETSATPGGFSQGILLSRTVSHIRQFAVPRRLPLLFDILKAAANGVHSHLILTNSDICVNPLFYGSVHSLLGLGFDCIVINRRTIEPLEHYGNHPWIGGLEVGAPHPGFDCFIFPTAWIADFATFDSCVGIGWVMRPLLYNLVARAAKMLILKAAHLTYHFGDDMPWKSAALADYQEHNRAQADLALQSLCRHSQARLRLEAFCAAHAEPFKPAPPTNLEEAHS